MAQPRAVVWFCLLSLCSPALAAGLAELVEAKEVPPPQRLYHWTSLARLQKWADYVERNNLPPSQLNLVGTVGGSLFASYLQSSIPNSQKALFAWDHPVGGMANSQNIYPERTEIADVAETLMKTFGWPDTPETRAQIERMGGTSVSGFKSGTNNQFLLDLDIDPNAKALQVVVRPGVCFPEEDYIEKVIPQLAEKKAQLVKFIIQSPDGTPAMQEWVVLDNRAVTHFNADPYPQHQTKFLKPHLERFKQGKSIEDRALHVRGSYLTTLEGRNEAIEVLTRLTKPSPQDSIRIPAIFRNPPAVTTGFERLGCTKLLSWLGKWNWRKKPELAAETEGRF